MKYRIFFLVLSCVLLASVSIARTYEVREREVTLTKVAEANGEAVFVVSSDNPERAVRVLKTATRLQQKGTQTTIMFEEQGVRLAAGLFARPVPEKLDFLFDKGVNSSHRPLKKKQRDNKATPNSTRHRKTIVQPQTVQEAITANISAGGKIMACPQCMQALGIAPSNLQDGIRLAPQDLVRNVHYIRRDR